MLLCDEQVQLAWAQSLCRYARQWTTWYSQVLQLLFALPVSRLPLPSGIPDDAVTSAPVQSLTWPSLIRSRHVSVGGRDELAEMLSGAPAQWLRRGRALSDGVMPSSINDLLHEPSVAPLTASTSHVAPVQIVQSYVVAYNLLKNALMALAEAREKFKNVQMLKPRDSKVATLQLSSLLIIEHYLDVPKNDNMTIVAENFKPYSSYAWWASHPAESDIAIHVNATLGYARV